MIYGLMMVLALFIFLGLLAYRNHLWRAQQRRRQEEEQRRDSEAFWSGSGTRAT